MAITRITAPALQSVREPNFRNIVINGDMAVSQRATSTASVTTNGYHACDRFRWASGPSTTAVVTISQDTDVPTGEGFATSFKVDVTTADASLDAADNIMVQQKFEGQNLQYLAKGTSDAKSTTLSFWVKSTKTGTYIATLYDRDNSRIISKSYTVSVSDTWEKKSVTFAGDTTGALGNDTGASLDVWWWVGAGSNYTSGSLATSWETYTAANIAPGQVNFLDSTSNNFLLTGVQLEAGSVATDFEVVPFGQNVERCCRYYQKYAKTVGPLQKNYYVGVNVSTSLADFQIDLVTPMRAAPTFGQSGTASDYNIDAVACAAIPTSAQGTSECGAGIRLTATGTPLVNKEAAYSTMVNSDSYFGFDAEL